MIIGYRLRRGATWGNALTADDYKDVAVKVVEAYDCDDTVQAYEVLERPTVTVTWRVIGGATRENGWAARGVG